MSLSFGREAVLRRRQDDIVDRNRFALMCSILMVVVLSPFWWGLFFPLSRLTVQAAIWALLIVWLATHHRERNLDPTVTWNQVLLGSVAAFAACYLLALPWAVMPRHALARALEGLTYVAFILLMLQTMQDGRYRRTYLCGIIISAMGLSATGLLAFAGVFRIPDAVLGGRIASTFQYPNTLAAALLVALPLSLGYLTQQQAIWRRSILAGGANILFLTFLLTYSRAAFLVFIPSLLATWLFTPRGRHLDTIVIWLLTIVPPIVGLQGIVANLDINNVISASRWFSVSLAFTLLSTAAWTPLRQVWPSVVRRIGVRPAAISFALAILLIVFGILMTVTYTGIETQALVSRFNPERFLERLENITLETHSAAQRLQYYSDAIRLAIERPLLGWGGGGWVSLYGMYQPYLYTASEVHNHFLQVWVESGTLGFASFISVWVVFIASLWIAYRRSGSEDRATLAGMAGAAIGLGMHSALDFDLSFMAMFLWLCTLASVSASWAGEVGIPACVLRVLRRAAVGVSRLKSLAIITAVAVLLVIGLMALGQNNLRLANAAWQSERYEEAESRFRQARLLDPLSADMASDMLFFYVSLHRYAPTGIGAARISETASIVAKLDPYGPTHNAQVTEAYLETGLWAEALDHARQTVSLQPFKSENYERLAQALVGRLMQALEESDLAVAQDLALELTNLPERVLERREQALAHVQRVDTNRPQIDLTPRLALHAAKGYYFLQDWTGAEDILAVASGSVGLTLEVDRWSYLLYEAMAEAGVTGAEDKLAAMGQKPWLRFIHLQPEYIRVRSLPFLE